MYKVFQYNYCFGGTREKKTWNIRPKCKFQYNYCFGGTISYTFITGTTHLVSIQLLFRWNPFCSLPCVLFCWCFNTTIVSVEHIMMQYQIKWKFVSIQLLFRWNRLLYVNIINLYSFQYNYCFGGTRLLYVNIINL